MGIGAVGLQKAVIGASKRNKQPSVDVAKFNVTEGPRHSHLHRSKAKGALPSWGLHVCTSKSNCVP